MALPYDPDEFRSEDLHGEEAHEAHLEENGPSHGQEKGTRETREISSQDCSDKVVRASERSPTWSDACNDSLSTSWAFSNCI